MSASSWIRNSAVILVAVACLAGCSGPVWKLPALKGEIPAPKTPPKGAGPTHVRASGEGFTLGDVERPACTPQQFVDRAAELYRQGQATSADRWVQRYPDIALSVLREPGSAQVPPDLLLRVAQAHDQQCARVPADAGWAAVCIDRGKRPDAYKLYDERRRQFLTHLQNGQAKEALAVNLTELPADVPGAMLAIDTLRLTGIAQILENHPQEAAASYDKAIAAAAGHPYQAVSLLLLASDAHRRAGKPQGAQQAWNQAARLAAELTAGPRPVIDPILWERVAYLRPVESNWPPEVAGRLHEVNLAFAIVPGTRNPVTPASTAGSSADEGPLWIAIGHWRLARNEPQAALVALKRAESSTSDNYTADRLQLSQAKTLASMGQAGPASAILIRLSSSADSRISHPALAMLGTMKLQQGGVQQGFNLLRRAVEADPALQWPERADAEADLGLAYLLMGDENTGLRCLHAAQHAWESSGQYEPLVQCLENEAAYFDQAKKKDLAESVRKRLETLKGA
jgi:tetratricopeptide (TPR) repeat protein